MSANVNNIINCSFNMYSCFFHFHEYTHHMPIICWLLSRILISSAHYNTEVFSDLTLPFKLLDSFPVLVSNILHRIRIKCCTYVCMYVLEHNIMTILYFLVIRRISLISAYLLLSAYYFAVLFTHYFAYKRMWPLTSISACFLARPGFQPFRISQNDDGYSWFSGFLKQC